MFRIRAVADESQVVLLVGPLGGAQQLHAEHACIEIDRPFQVADAKHGVEQVHGNDYAALMIIVPTIRLATLRDARAIAEMSRDEIEAGLSWTWTPERVRRSIRDRATNVAVAQEARRVVGFGIMVYGDEKAHLSLLAVHASRREHGV